MGWWLTNEGGFAGVARESDEVGTRGSEGKIMRVLRECSLSRRKCLVCFCLVSTGVGTPLSRRRLLRFRLMRILVGLIFASTPTWQGIENHRPGF